MDAEMPEEFYLQATNILPPDGPPGPQGGRPRVPNRTVLAVLWYVLVAGVRWKDVPRAFGGSGRTAHRRLQYWQKLGLFGSLHQLCLDALRRAGKLSADTVILDSFQVRAHGGGELTGPNPTDRRKKGSKHTVLVDERGTPLVIVTCGSHVSDHCQILPTVLAFLRIRGKPGAPKTRPKKLYADRGYDSAAARAILRRLGIKAVIAQRNGAWQRTGRGAVGGGAHHQLAEGYATYAASVRSSRHDAARVERARRDCYVLPSPRVMRKPVVPKNTGSVIAS
ncbi:MAG: IS5 family transposase [Pirellulales bacterium]|nr:IS5 family transposase [Pirellulales bacterium]